MGSAAASAAPAGASPSGTIKLHREGVFGEGAEHSRRGARAPHSRNVERPTLNKAAISMFEVRRWKFDVRCLRRFMVPRRVKKEMEAVHEQDNLRDKGAS